MEAEKQALEQTRPTRALADKRLRGCMIALIGACVLTAVASGFSYAADALFAAPWAYPVFGRQTLTGVWEGEFSTPTGITFALFLDIHRAVLANGTPHIENYQGALISGSASWCDNHGRKAADVPINGAVPTFQGLHGQADHIEIDLETASHPQQGLLPDVLQGSWKGDTLTLHPRFAFWNGKTFIYSSNDPDINAKITIILKKVGIGAFPAACGTLKGAAP